MKSLIVIAIVVVLKVFGDVCLSHGMRQVGEVHPLNFLEVFAIGFRTITNPWVDIAMALLLSYTIIYFSALSWLDLSYLLPMTTSGYVLNALLAWLLLNEKVTGTRWLGTVVIVVGVMFVGMSDHHKKRRRKALKPYQLQNTNTQDNQDEIR